MQAPEASGVHWTQLPVDSLQTGVEAKATHCASSVQEPHVWVAELQTGASAEQSELRRHWTHWPSPPTLQKASPGAVQSAFSLQFELG